MKKDYSKESFSQLEKELNEDIEKILQGNWTERDSHTLSVKRSNLIFSRIKRQIFSNTISFRSSLLKIAAVLIPLIFLNSSLWYVFLYDSSNEYTEIAANKGDKLIVVLPDGSKIWLNSESKLRYPTKFSVNSRSVELSGEAFFEVAKDDRHPFVVNAGDVEIKVLGTRFNVTAYNDEKFITSSLEEGSIKLSTRYAKDKSYQLTPGQSAIYSKNDGLLNIHSTPDHLKESDWKNNVLRFNNTPLEIVLKRMERQYNVEFELHDSQLSKYTYTFISEDESVEEVLAGMKAITPITYVKLNKHTYLIRNKTKNNLSE